MKIITAQPVLELTPFQITETTLITPTAHISETSRHNSRNHFLSTLFSFIGALLLIQIVSAIFLHFNYLGVLFLAVVNTAVIYGVIMLYKDSYKYAFEQKASQLLRDTVTNNLAQQSEPVKEWLNSKKVDVTEETLENIVTSFWDSDTDMNSFLGISNDNLRSIPFQDVVGVHYSLIPTEKGYQLTKQVV